MSRNVAHAVGVFVAGVLAFGAVYGATLLASNAEPQAEGSHSAETGPSEPDAVVIDDASLTGRWQAPEPANQDAYVEFTEYGMWFASDGCNGLDGTWQLGLDGTLEIEGAKAMTMIACDNVPIPTAVSDAVSVSFENENTLLLTGADGTETELLRTRVDGVSLVGTWAPVDPTAVDGVEIEFTSETAWTWSDGCSTARGSWELLPATSYGTSDAEAAVLPGEFSVGEFSADDEGTGDQDCGAPDSADLLGTFTNANGLAFLDANRITLVYVPEDTADGAWQTLALGRVG